MGWLFAGGFSHLFSQFTFSSGGFVLYVQNQSESNYKKNIHRHLHRFPPVSLQNNTWCSLSGRARGRPQSASVYLEEQEGGSEQLLRCTRPRDLFTIKNQSSLPWDHLGCTGGLEPWHGHSSPWWPCPPLCSSASLSQVVSRVMEIISSKYWEILCLLLVSHL